MKNPLDFHFGIQAQKNPQKKSTEKSTGRHQRESACVEAMGVGGNNRAREAMRKKTDGRTGCAELYAEHRTLAMGHKLHDIGLIKRTGAHWEISDHIPILDLQQCSYHNLVRLVPL